MAMKIKSTIDSSIVESHKHNVEWNKSGTEEYVLWFHLYKVQKASKNKVMFWD